LGSVVAEETEAVLVMVVPPEPSAVATSVMVADAPTASEENVTVRLLPVPPQTPPPVELQETNVTFAGRLSVTTTDCATPGPLFVTVIV
jgi:hypothetical protein